MITVYSFDLQGNNFLEPIYYNSFAYLIYKKISYFIFIVYLVMYPIVFLNIKITSASGYKAGFTH